MKLVKWSAALLIGLWGMAQAAITLDQAQVVSATNSLATMVPAASTVTVTTAGTYTLTLSDVQHTGHPFSSLSVVLSQGSQLIKFLPLPTTSATASIAVTLGAGQYQVQVFGVTPDASQYSVELKDAANVTALSDSAVITAPSVDQYSSLQQSINVTSGQSYTLTLSDRVFPAALADLQASVVQNGNTIVCPVTAAGSAASCTFTASGSSAQLTVIANEVSGSAGLYSVKVANSMTGDVAYGATLPLGTMPDAVPVNLPTTDAYTLNSIDFQNPSPLGNFKLALVQGAELLVKQGAAGTSSNFTGNAGPASLFVIAAAPSNSASQYSVLIRSGTTTVANVVDSVTDTATTGLEGHVFTVAVPAAGNYSLQLRDFAFPQLLSVLNANVSQNGTVLGTLSAQGTLTLTSVAAGELTIAVLAKPAASSSAGLLGVNLSASGSSSPILEKTQGIGSSFVSRDVTITAAGHYVINATDFSAPVPLSQLQVAITRGANLVGSIFGGGTFAVDATAGTYTVSFLSVAAASPGYGMFGYSMASAPTVTLSASVASGGAVTLTWSATDANTCTATGGWSGSKAINGSETAGPITTDTSYTLTCGGAGGSTAKSVTASLPVAAAAKSGGGGGAISLLSLWSLLLLAGIREFARPR